MKIATVSYNAFDKLECLSLASFYNLVWCLQVRPEPTQEKHLWSAPLLGWILSLSTNIRLSWKSLPWTNT